MVVCGNLWVLIYVSESSLFTTHTEGRQLAEDTLLPCRSLRYESATLLCLAPFQGSGGNALLVFLVLPCSKFIYLEHVLASHRSPFCSPTLLSLVWLLILVFESHQRACAFSRLENHLHVL